MDVFDEALEEIQSEESNNTLGKVKQFVKEAPERIFKGTMREAGAILGTLNVPSAAVWGWMTPYEDEYQREEFEKQDVLTQVTLMAGSAIQSAYDSATKKGSFGKGYGSYYKAQTGKDAPVALEMAIDMITDPLLIKGIPTAIAKRQAMKLANEASERSIKNIRMEQVSKAFSQAKSLDDYGKAWNKVADEADTIGKVDVANQIDEPVQKIDDIVEEKMPEITKETADDTAKVVDDIAEQVPIPDEAPVPSATDIKGIPEEATGKLRPHSTALKINERELSEELIGQQDVGNVAAYRQVEGMMKQQAAKAIKIMDDNFDDAVEMAFGRKEVPEGVYQGTMLTAVAKELALRGDAKTLRSLAVSKEAYQIGAEEGRAVKAYDTGITDSPFQALKEITKKAVENIKKRTGTTPVKNLSEIEKKEKAIEEMDKEISKRVKMQMTDFDKEITEALADGDDRYIGNLIYKLYWNLIDAGLSDRKILTGRVHEILKDFIPDITERDIAESLTNYGKYKKYEADEVTKRLAQVKGELMQDLKLEDLSQGKRPLPTGVGRVEPSDEYHRLTKQVNRDMRKMGFKYISTEKVAKSAEQLRLEKIERTIESLELSIEKIKNKIGSHDLSTKVKEDLGSPRVNELRKTLSSLNGLLSDIRNSKKSRDEFIATQNKINSLQKTILRNKERIREGDVAVRESTSPTNDIIKELQIENQNLNKQIADMRNYAKEKRTAAEINEQRVFSRLEKEYKALEDEINSLKLTEKTSVAKVTSQRIEELTKMKKELKSWKEEIFAKDIQERAIKQEIESLIKKRDEHLKKIASKNVEIKKAEKADKYPKAPEELKKELASLQAEDKELVKRIKEIRDEIDPHFRYRSRLIREEAKFRKLLDERKQIERKTNKNYNADTTNLIRARDSAKSDYEAVMKAAGAPTIEQVQTLLDLSASKDRLLKLRGTPEWEAGAKRDYGLAKVAYDNYVTLLKDGDKTLFEAFKDRMKEFKTTWSGAGEVKQDRWAAVGKLMLDTLNEVSETSIAMVASMDNSFIGRQGLTTLLTHPTVWLKAADQSFTDIATSLRSKHGNQITKDLLRADIVSRDKYIDGIYQKAGIIAKVEEEFPVTHPQRIPYLGRLFKASESAFENSATRMRVGLFDLLYDNAKKIVPEMNDEIIQDIGKLVNSMTARAPIKERGILKAIFWAPKMMAANFNTLTAHGFGSGAGFGGRLETAFARKQAALNLGKMVFFTGAVAAMLNQLKPGSVELDPRSADFLKGRFGDTRIDLTGGKGQYIVLAARMFTMAPYFEGSVKSSQTKILHKLNTGKEMDPQFIDVGVDFFLNKVNPFMRAGIDIIGKGETFEGTKPTVASTLSNIFVPIYVQNVIDGATNDYTEDKMIVSMITLLDAFGINVNTYRPVKHYSEDDNEKILKLKEEIGEEELKKLEILYNKEVNKQIEEAVNSPWYKEMDSKEKDKIIKGIRRSVKQQTFGFR